MSHLQDHVARSNAKLAARPVVDVGGLLCEERTHILDGIPAKDVKGINHPQLLCLPYHPADGAIAATRVTVHTKGTTTTPKSKMIRDAEGNYAAESLRELAHLNERRTRYLPGHGRAQGLS